MYSSGKIADDVVAIFGKRKETYEREEFPGANITAVFGGVSLELQDAVITEDVVIQVTTLFGGVDIYLPKDVEVKVNSFPLFGSISNKTSQPMGQTKAVIYVNATNILGGIEIR